MSLDTLKQEMLEKMFGIELASEIINGAEAKSRELEGRVAFKETEQVVALKTSIEGMEDGELKTALAAALEAHSPAQKDEEEEKEETEEEKPSIESKDIKEVFGILGKALVAVNKGVDALTKRLDSVDTQLVELKKSDDEKIAAQFTARKGAPASQAEGNIILDINKILEDAGGEEKGKDKADKFASPYVNDLLARVGVGGLPEGDGS